MQCPRCQTDMQQREGRYGPFLFCPNQYECRQKTISLKPTRDISPAEFNRQYYGEPRISEPPLENEYPLAGALDSSDGGMARIAYENAREHEHTRDRASVDGMQVLFGGGMFCDMGMEDDDEDQRPW